MKKVYWIFFIIFLITAVLDLVFSFLEIALAMAITSVVMVISLIVMIVIYFGFVKFKCPKCGTKFRGSRWEVFFAMHTPTKRRMTCPFCKEKVWCEDIFESSKNSNYKENKDT